MPHKTQDATLVTMGNNGIYSLVSTGNIPIEGRTVDGRERKTESVTRKEVKKIQVWSKGERGCHSFCVARSCGSVVFVFFIGFVVVFLFVLLFI